MRGSRTMNVHERTIIGVRRRLAVLLVLKQAVAFLTAWAFLWGTVVLVLRAALAVGPLHLLWGLAALPALLGLAAAIALRRLPPSLAVRALVDRASGSGGLLLAAEEQD